MMMLEIRLQTRESSSSGHLLHSIGISGTTPTSVCAAQKKENPFSEVGFFPGNLPEFFQDFPGNIQAIS